MERGFYHPSRGYWQTTGEVPESIISTYPVGTVEVSLKPGCNFNFDGSKWVEFAVEDQLSYEISKVEIIRRMTTEEATSAELLIASENAKFRLMWSSANIIRSDDEWFPILQAALAGAFGEERAAQLLAPVA